MDKKNDEKKQKELEKAFILFDSNDIDSAIKAYSKLHKTYPDDIGISIGYGKILIKKEEMKEKGIKILSKFQNSIDSLNALEELAKEEGNIYLAIEYCKHILDICKSIKTLNIKMYDIATLYKKVGKLNLSKFYFKKLINTDYRKVALLNLLYIEMNLENYSEALELFNMCLSENVNFDKNRISFLLKYKLGLLDIGYKPNNYFENQIVNYNNLEALNQIKKQLLIKNPNLNETKILDLYYSCEDLIEDMQPSQKTYIDIYDFNINEFSFCDKVRVLTLQDTKKILNIFISKENNKVKKIQKKATL